MRRVIEEDTIFLHTKKDLGQFFTTNPTLQQWMINHIKNKGELLMEPSFGAGHLIHPLLQENPVYPMICYEVDQTITPITTFTDKQTVIYGDFTNQVLPTTIRTIIGNPPYVKQREGNLYLIFMEKCFRCLETDGELLFIVPSDFLKVTRAANLLTTMCESGSFTDFYFPHDESLFEEASIDVVLFRYQKGLVSNVTTVNDKQQILVIRNGIITFHDTLPKGTPLEDHFHVAVGLVSGKDEVFETPLGNLDVLVDQGKTKRFLYLETFPSDRSDVNDYLLSYKKTLLDRKIKSFNETNWFQWGAPRNKSLMEEHLGKPCIYVRNITRQTIIAFRGTVQYFGGTLIILVPKNDMTEERIQSVLDQLNSDEVRNAYSYAGRFKIGHKQVSNIYIE